MTKTNSLEDAQKIIEQEKAERKKLEEFKSKKITELKNDLEEIEIERNELATSIPKDMINLLSDGLGSDDDLKNEYFDRVAEIIRINVSNRALVISGYSPRFFAKELFSTNDDIINFLIFSDGQTPKAFIEMICKKYKIASNVKHENAKEKIKTLYKKRSEIETAISILQNEEIKNVKHSDTDYIK